MKKIGILTFHRSINFGAYMQSFALSNKLQKEFPECKVEIVDYESKFMAENYKPKFTLSCIKHPKLYPDSTKRYQSFQKALKYLPLSERYFVFDGENIDFSDYIEDNYDLIVVGSDAVWNWIKRGFPNSYLLPFDSKVKKCSYAASAYGMDLKYVGDTEKSYFEKCLNDYFFVGVRDTHTMNLVNYVSPQKEVSFTCDPTILLELNMVEDILEHTHNSFRDMILKKYRIPEDAKIIGVMESNPRIVQVIKKHYGNKYFIVSLYNNLKGADCYMSDLNPLEWSLIFGLFELTLTNYFHGTLLSIRNGTPVICFDRTEFSKTNEGKIYDVLRRMDMLDCYNQGEVSESEILKKTDDVLCNVEFYRKKIQTGCDNLSKSFNPFIEAVRGAL